uniref:CRAL-TRIO domain-containing protein n=1 Tax=Timema genevievae TaxID=629358 RepID=A0A7R9JWD5_TIMGE|nr:unnamed protein product [Timema genevievae]
MLSMFLNASGYTSPHRTAKVRSNDLSTIRPRRCDAVRCGAVRLRVAGALEGFPAIVSRFHLINCGPVVDKLYALVKPLVKKELLGKIVLHSSGLEDFYKIVPNEVLPKEYGGKAGPIEEAHNEVTYKSTPVRDSSEKEDEEYVEEESCCVTRSEYDEVEKVGAKAVGKQALQKGSHILADIATKELAQKVGDIDKKGVTQAVEGHVDNLNTDVWLKILDATLFMKHVEVSPSISLAIEKTLLRKPAQYHINRVDVKFVTIPKGSNTSTLAYDTLFSGLGIHHQKNRHLITRDMFNKGYFMLAFDLTPDTAGQDSHTSLHTEGNVRFELQFKTDLDTAINSLFYSDHYCSLFAVAKAIGCKQRIFTHLFSTTDLCKNDRLAITLFKRHFASCPKCTRWGAQTCVPALDIKERSYEKIKQHRNWFIEEEKLRVDESKRLGKAKSAGDVFGLEGSFKKLDID